MSLLVAFIVAQTAVATSPAIVHSEVIFPAGRFGGAHASTVVETQGGLLAAWFAGTQEGASDVGIWTSRRVNGAWSPPAEVATGAQADGKRYPCWNPVLFSLTDGRIALFYKVGPSPQAWWGMVRHSRDDGRTWSDAVRLPDGVLGPIKNKPVRLSDGTIIAGSSVESSAGWRVHFERSTDGGTTWTVVHPPASTLEINAIQPSILMYPGARLQAVGRSQEKRIFETWSSDGGKSWSPLALTSLPNPNSGIDAVTLADLRQLVVYNHTTQGRSPLNVAVSTDGKTWEAALVLEDAAGEYSYPAVIQTADGLVHVTYTWKRQTIKHVVLDPAKLSPVPMTDGRWPK
jgi:predicted neuraminidase